MSIIKVEMIKDGWLKHEEWLMSPAQAKSEARRLIRQREAEYILLIDNESRAKLLYIHRSPKRCSYPSR